MLDLATGVVMDFVFYVIPALICAVAIGAAVGVVRRSLQRRRAWSSGLVAEGRCLRTYTTTRRHSDHASTTLHHVYEFTLPEGRAVRFEEEHGPATIVEGDIVPVHYTAGNPEHATAHRRRPAANAASTVGALIFLGAVVAFCLLFMASFATDFGSTGSDVTPSEDFGDEMP